MDLQVELPVISQYVSKIAKVHGPNNGEALFELEKLYHKLQLVLETRDVPLNEVDLCELQSQLKVLLSQMRAVTSDYLLPAHACRTYTLTFAKLQELESDLTTRFQL